MSKVNDISPLVELRHWLHQHPEIAGKEKLTAQKITEFLQALSPDELITGVGGEGIVATFDSGRKGKCLLFRSELDALPIAEENNFKHASIHAGNGHKCGHDGHMAIVCGVAQWLANNKDNYVGKVILLFQPAEETGQGAMRMLADKRMKNSKPDFAFALHNLPEFELGAVLIKEGIFTASINSLVIRLKGHTSHAAEPEKGKNPGAAIANILLFAEQLNDNNPASETFSLVTLVHVNIGSKAYGTSAGEGEIHFTLRCFDEARLRKLERDLLVFAGEEATKDGLKIEHQFLETFFANNNDKEAVQVVKHAAMAALLPLQWMSVPFKWGEDFGLFTKHFAGCMVGLGAGVECKPLHHPAYDFPDSLIEKGVALFTSIIKVAG